MGVKIIVNVLLSIKNKYAQQILTGHKKFEFRKNFPEEEVDKIYLYISYPYQQIIGYITSEYILKSTIPEIRERCYKEWTNFDSEKDGFDDYFRTKYFGVAIKIDDVVVFNERINPYEFDGFKPPQSYYLMSDELEEFILRKIECQTTLI